MRRKLHLHDLSTEKDFSGNMGKLIPTHWRICYPGDVVRERAEYFVRVSPLLAPIISKVMIKAESFFVPTDIVWTGAQEFYSRGQDGTSTKVIPYRTENSASPWPAEGSLIDYLGMAPKKLAATFNYNILPIRVYNAIYNWHYADQDLSTMRTISLGDGPDTTTTDTLASRCWERDRFTTARLEPQRGDDVLIPSGDPATFDTTGKNVDILVHTEANAGDIRLRYDTITGAPVIGPASTFAAGASDLRWGAETGLETEVDFALGAGTIRDLEEAVAIQRFRTRLQTADGSYPDYCLATFGIRAPDIELQKPVLLARSSSPLQISEIVQTSPDDGATDPDIGVGTLFGHGIATARGHGYKYKVKRHGYIMTIFSVVPKTMYVQGTDKEWWRSTPEDYWDPDLDMIGEEAILAKEINALQTDSEQVIGYQYRNYCDRSSLNTVAGEMRTTLNFWHQARDFSGDVALNNAFVTCDPTDRIFALGSIQDQLRVKAMHEVKMLRPLRRIPMRGIL